MEARGGCISPLQVGAEAGVRQLGGGSWAEVVPWQVPRGLDGESTALVGGRDQARGGRRQRNSR